MADAVVYNPHSITFIDSVNNSFNTWDDWKLLPTERPVINPPEVRTEYIEIPGMPGALDYTEALSGRPIYGMRKGSWEFMALNVQDGYAKAMSWAAQFSDIMHKLHGQKRRVILRDDDPLYYYEGRIEVKEYKADKERSKVSIDYMLDPYKTPLVTSQEEEWKWDDLFGISKIIYGKFNVSGSKFRTIINSNDTAVGINTDSTASLTAYIYEAENSDVITSSVIIPSGITDTGILQVNPGRTKIKFEGYANITLYYGEGRIL